MRTTINFFRFIPAIIFLLFLITCKKDNKTIGTETVNPTYIEDSIITKNITISNIKQLLSGIPDSTADSYYQKYLGEFKPSLTNKGQYPFLFRIQDKVVDEIKALANSNKDTYVHFILTNNNNKLGLLFESGKKKYFVTEVSKLTEIDSLKFSTMDSNFRTVIYPRMNEIKSKLIASDPKKEGDNSYDNSTDVMIPYKTFDEYQTNTADSVLTLLPGIVTENKANSNSKSKKHHFTLILAIFPIDANKAFLPPTVYYDDFCLKPPGC
ncbi:hypothetical protein [Chryseobacterium taichungense]|uniref:hypothetical protein n=1 Tax=Chryseobacterium taichungense TaxID=295069 RepID=UPI0028A59130|nr:hypothetical protein [Chryseobacterium taichungense]